jgi:8-oxo-dGDP phosphatase
VKESWVGPIKDTWEPAELLDQRIVHRGAKWDVVVEQVAMGNAVVQRDVVVHPGAVAVVALNEHEQIFLIRQYRQPLGMYLFETPAGLLDHGDEDPLGAAQRELAEEAGLMASDWKVLVDFYNSPGGSSEAIRIFLARGVAQVPGGRIHTGEAEEMHLPGVWVDLDAACSLVLAGDLGNPTTVVGALAAQSSMRSNWHSLRPAEAPWQAHAERKLVRPD